MRPYLEQKFGTVSLRFGVEHLDERISDDLPLLLWLRDSAQPCEEYF